MGTAHAFALADPTKPHDTKVVATEWVNALFAPGLAMPLVRQGGGRGRQGGADRHVVGPCRPAL